MLEKRIIPILLLDNRRLVKGVSFKNHIYIGDPINTVHLFNEKQANEIIILDISSRKNKKKIQYELLNKISLEAFLPLTYGGGINSLDEALRIIDIGYEKVILNTSVITNPNLISEIANKIGSQSIIVSIDVNFINNNYYVFSNNGEFNTNIVLRDYLKKVQQSGAGEIMITSIQNEGKMIGYDEELLKYIEDSVNIPIIINGGAKDYDCFKNVFKKFSVSACAASSVFLFIGKYKAVLISYPNKKELMNILR
jgi:cyclase